MRSKSDKDYIEERSVGRRAADRGVCMFHDMCHETIAEMKQGCLNNIDGHKQEHDNMEKDMKGKLDWKVFALFVGGAVTLGIAFVLFVAPLILDMSSAITKIDTNQQHMMEELSIKPVQK